ncbi:TetR family transcriptional regulator C-terminal domain-containing protein [Rhodobaculum claviforme]|uniref:TetR family transcriptional regulator n=1 Tax=Rhodobaculum claviforme TaxID=1549854 RepID=A0A934TMQ2_9RHOB|nr:TetR family transcriptional regulator C-terminal domain-containing protein [Rhodobaculum claviforme]MBK5928316.1 TetR family transcriptional regulator [Rhodobaculum claviforme]
MTVQVPTRIQMRNRRRILDAALEVFAQRGFDGATLDRIAQAAGLSKPNVLYYFDSKAAIHRALLTDLLEAWIAPLRALDPDGDPQREILGYVRRKLEMSREFPRESRLFANEILHGAPHVQGFIRGELKRLVDDRAAVIGGWVRAGRIARVDPVHLIISIWALTQHYADFEAQIRMIRGEDADPLDGAAEHLEMHFTRLLAP